MKKLRVYPGNAFGFYREVVASKRNSADDPTYRQRLNDLEGIVQPLFQTYDDRFLANELQSLAAHALTPAQRADLLRLYAYKNSVFQKLKIQLTTLELNQVLNICQCCTIGEVGSFDHLVPKDEFPEFSANPKNLFPACNKCNSYKLAAWRHNGARTFLNLFLDDLPTQQYLFADLNIDGDGTVTADFALRNINNIDPSLFALIESHYNNLHLLARFKENVDSVVIPIVSAIKAAKDVGLTKARTVEQIVANCRSNQIFFGSNYWKSILELSLAANAMFIDTIYDNHPAHP